MSDVDAPAQGVSIICGLECGEVGQSGKREVDFRDRPRHPVVLQFLYEIG